MQQISDHVRQEFMADNSWYLHPSQRMQTATLGCNTYTVSAAAMCHQQEPLLVYGQCPVGAATLCHASPVQTADATADPRVGAMLHTPQHHQPFMQVQASRSPFVHSPSIQEPALSSQPTNHGNHNIPLEQHQMLPSNGPAFQHLRTQPVAVSCAPKTAPGGGQLPCGIAAANSLQHASATAGLYNAPRWQYSSMRPPESSSIAPPSAPLPAAASLPASMSCEEQYHLYMPPQGAHVTAVSMGISTSQPSGLVSCHHQSMCAPSNQQQLQQQQGAVSDPAALCSDNADSQMLYTSAGDTSPSGPATSLVAQTPSMSVGPALPMTQEATADSLRRPKVQGNQLDSVQQQQWQPQPQQQQQQQSSLAPQATVNRAPRSLPAQQAFSGSTGAVPGCQLSRPCSSAPTGAAGFSSLLRAVEQGQPAVTSHAAAAPVTHCNATGFSPAISAADCSSVPSHTALNSIDAPPAVPHSRTVPLPVPAAATGPTMPASVMPLSVSSPSHAQAAATAHEQQLKLASGKASLIPACQAQHLQSSKNGCAVGSAAALSPSEPADTGLATDQAASEGSFRFQTGGDHRRSASAGMCCTPVLRSRNHNEPCKAGM